MDDIKGSTAGDAETKDLAIKDEMYWWLNNRRSFKIGDEYEIVLLGLDYHNKAAKILIRNLKTMKEKAEQFPWSQYTSNEEKKSVGELLSMFSEGPSDADK